MPAPLAAVQPMPAQPAVVQPLPAQVAVVQPNPVQPDQVNPAPVADGNSEESALEVLDSEDEIDSPEYIIEFLWRYFHFLIM